MGRTRESAVKGRLDREMGGREEEIRTSEVINLQYEIRIKLIARQ